MVGLIRKDFEVLPGELITLQRTHSNSKNVHEYRHPVRAESFK